MTGSGRSDGLGFVKCHLRENTFLKYCKHCRSEDMSSTVWRFRKHWKRSEQEKRDLAPKRIQM